jgi:RNA-directed DNA polymerase
MGREFHVRFREGLGVQFPRATRLVICCRGSAHEAMTAMRDMMARLRLTVNEAKTRLCRGPDERFDFLGYTIGTCYAPQTGWAYTGVRPSAKKVRDLKRKLSGQTARSWLWLDVDELVGRLNALLRGWANYFCLGTVAAVYNDVNFHVCCRLRHWLSRKFQLRGPQWSRHADRSLHETLGLLRLRRPSAQLSHANA